MTIKQFMGLFSVFCILLSCNAQTDKFKSLTVKEFAIAIEDTSIIRLDVRTSDEYAQGHIANSINIDVLKPDFEQTALAILPKDKTIAVYCRSGKRSKKAAKILVSNNYQVLELNTGFNDWTSQGKHVVK